jgi:hypothetical protein
MRSIFFLLVTILLSFDALRADQRPYVVEKSSFVYLTNEVREALSCLPKIISEDNWSASFRNLYDGIVHNSIAASYDQAYQAIQEALIALHNCAENEAKDIKKILHGYMQELENGDAYLVFFDEQGMIAHPFDSYGSDSDADCNDYNREMECTRKCCVKFKNGIKAYCKLLAKDLTVCGSGFINNLTTNVLRVNQRFINNSPSVFNGDATFCNLTVDCTFTANGPSNIGANLTNDTINIGTNAAIGGRAVNIGNSVPGSTTTIIGDISTMVLGNGGNIVSTATGSISETADGNITLLTNGASNINLNTTTGSINLNGNGLTTVENVASPLVSGVTASANSARVGQVSFTGLGIAAGEYRAHFITGTPATSSSRIIAIAFSNQVNSPGPILAIQNMRLLAPTVLEIDVANAGTVALDPSATIFINFWILN